MPRYAVALTPVACKDGIRDAWCNTAAFAGNALRVRFGDQVSLEYYALFSSDMDRFPQVLALVAAGRAQVSLVFGDELLSSGGAISIPDIRRRLEALECQVRK